MRRKKQKKVIEKYFAILDGNGKELERFPDVRDIAKATGLSVSYIYNIANERKYVDSKLGNVAVKYYRNVKMEDIPFVIPEDKRTTIKNLPGEKWQVIPNMPDCNWASTKGRFKVVDTMGNEMENNIQLSKNAYGKRTYRDVVLVNPDGKNIRARASRVLAHTFIDPKFPIFTRKGTGLVVDHRDNDSLNDEVSNLRIVTHKQNLYAARYEQNATGYYMPNKAVLCVETGDIYPSAAEASRAMGFDYVAAIANAANPNQRPKTAAGYHWRYTNKKPNVKTSI
jgi:hypothetical protein